VVTLSRVIEFESGAITIVSVNMSFANFERWSIQ